MKYILLTLLVMQFGVFSQTFTEITSVFPAVSDGDSDWGDYDNDGDLDIVLSGMSDSLKISKLFRNDGNWTFTEIPIGLPGVQYSSVNWGDYNNDGFLDILLSGTSISGDITKIYENNSDDTFSDIGVELTGTSKGSQWGDYNKDGKLDVLLGDGTYYLNNDPTFDIFYTGLSGKCKWFDYDGDGDYDVSVDYRLVGGDNDLSTDYTRIYRNDHSIFSFFKSFKGYYNSSADYNNDGYLDFVTMGEYRDLYNYYYEWYSYLFRSDSTENYLKIDLLGRSNGSSCWGDYNNDGDLDLVTTGFYGVGDPIVHYEYYCDTRILKCYSSGSISYQLQFTGIYKSSVDWVDCDNDGDLDLFMTGLNTSTGRVLELHRNNNQVCNTVPNSPTGLDANVNGSAVVLSWNSATDNETPQEGLSYNIYIGTQSGTSDVLDPMSIISSGYRKVVRIGNAGKKNYFEINDLPAGTYYWSVQTIDNCFAGSEFAPEQSIIVTGIEEQALPFTTELLQNYPNPFNPETVIKYSLEKESHVNIRVFDIAGREVCTLVNKKQDRGFHEAKFIAINLTSGMYLYQLLVESKVTDSRKMMILK